MATSHWVGVGAMPVTGSGMPVHCRSTGVPESDSGSNAAKALSEVKPIAAAIAVLNMGPLLKFE